ncbi:MAG: hypothetical protein HOP30_15125 [Cyclobacteriaceae bacterium]|nr:hypothetical protein [Cyclobacteriaceae bacterium]
MRVLLLIFSILVSIDALGQEGILWLTKEFQETDDSTTAMYRRIVDFYNQDNTMHVTDFLVTGEKYFEGSVVYVNAGLPVNNFKYFYKNGNLKIDGYQTVLKPSGFEKFTTKEYHSNGQLRSEYVGDKSKLRIIQSFDSLGNSLLINGEGRAMIADEYNQIIWSGRLKDFKMDSIWTAIDIKTKQPIHTEYFAKGTFIKGSTMMNGQLINYKKESGYVKPSFIRKIETIAKAEILRQIPKNKRQPEYKVGILFRNGKPIQIIHLRKNLNEVKLNFHDVPLPEYTFMERGVPIKSLTLGLRTIKVD